LVITFILFVLFQSKKRCSNI